MGVFVIQKWEYLALGVNSSILYFVVETCHQSV